MGSGYDHSDFGRAVNLTNNHEGWSINKLAWSADGKTLAYTAGRRWWMSEEVVWIVDVTAPNVSPVNLTNTPLGSIISSLTWSHDSKTLAYTTENRFTQHCVLFVIEMSAPKPTPVKVTNNPSTTIKRPTWTRDSKKLAYVTSTNGDDDMWVVEFTSTAFIAHKITDNPPGTQSYKPVWAGDNKKLAWIQKFPGANSSDVLVVDTTTDPPTPVIVNKNVVDATNNYPWFDDLAWSPGSTRLGFTIDEDIQIVDVTTKNPTLVFTADLNPRGNLPSNDCVG